MKRESGFALLIVLWTLVLISLLLTGLAASARSDAQLTANLRSAAELEAEADGAISTAIFALLQPGKQSAARDSATEVSSLSGLVNPNVVSPELLRALLFRLGTDPNRAEALASAIVDWRSPSLGKQRNGAKAAEYRAAGLEYGPPGAPYETLAELREVLGMTPGLFAALLPHVTLYWDEDPEPQAASPLVRAAMRDAGLRRGPGQAGHDVVLITATASRPNGARVTRRAIIRLGRSGNQRLWRTLVWETASV